MKPEELQEKGLSISIEMMLKTDDMPEPEQWGLIMGNGKGLKLRDGVTPERIRERLKEIGQESARKLNELLCTE